LPLKGREKQKKNWVMLKESAIIKELQKLEVGVWRCGSGGGALALQSLEFKHQFHQKQTNKQKVLISRSRRWVGKRAIKLRKGFIRTCFFFPYFNCFNIFSFKFHVKINDAANKKNMKIAHF
jgi:hypothetical protein